MKAKKIKKEELEDKKNVYVEQPIPQEILIIEDIRRGRTIQLQSSKLSMNELLGISDWIKKNHFEENNNKRDYV